MKGLICAGIAPHGFSIVPEISGDEFELFKPTRDAMEELGRVIMKNKPDTIIVLTPHGLRIKGYNAIYTSQYCKGDLSGKEESIRLEYKCDRQVAEDILKAALKKNIASVGCNFGALEGPMSNIEMDWGTSIPLYFCKDENYKPEIVVIAPSREIPIGDLVKFGQVIGEVCERFNKKIALIASADQGHCHHSKGPYGFDKASKEYDDIISNIIREDNLEKLLSIDNELIEKAKPDSFWQMLILYGALKKKPMAGKLLSYEVPTYFGMSVAIYKPINA